jgi:hypothetical protein
MVSKRWIGLGSPMPDGATGVLHLPIPLVRWVRARPDARPGVLFTVVQDGRAAYGRCDRLPGRLVYVRDVCGVRLSVGYSACESTADIASRLAYLMGWCAGGQWPEWMHEPSQLDPHPDKVAALRLARAQLGCNL